MKIKHCLLNLKIKVDSLQTVVVKDIVEVATLIEMDSFTQSHYSWAQQPTSWGTLKGLVGQTQQCTQQLNHNAQKDMALLNLTTLGLNSLLLRYLRKD